MRAYELMVIFDGDVEDTAVNAILANVNTLVEAGGGNVKSGLAEYTSGDEIRIECDTGAACAGARARRRDG